MRQLYVTVVLICLGLGLGCGKKTAEAPAPKEPQKKPEIYFSYHFAGTKLLSANTNSAKLKDVWALPETKVLRERTLQKLANAPQELFKQRINPPDADRAPLLRPLLDDLLEAESASVLQGLANQTPEWALAVHLDEARANLWQTNLWQLMAAWQVGAPAEIKGASFSGWEVRTHDAPNLFRIVWTGQWLALGLGQGDLPALQGMLDRIKTDGRPLAANENSWLAADVKLAWLAELLDLPAWLKGPTGLWPQAHLDLYSKADNLRTKLNLVYPEELRLNRAPWQIPTNTIRDPMISFTAARGLSSWLSNTEVAKKLEIKSPPDQLFVWAQNQIPFQTFIIMPTTNATNLIESVANHLPIILDPNLLGRGIWQFLYVTNRTELLWRPRLPIVVPFLRPVHEPNGEYVMAGMFPELPVPNPPPPELIEQLVGQTNLFYYDWEITQARLRQWRQLAQLYALLKLDLTNSARARLFAGKVTIPGQEWLEAISSHNKIGYILRHGISPNGGGVRVNQYTLIMDAMVGPAGSGLASMLQINSLNNSDDGDLFWQDNNFGEGAGGFNGAGAFTPGAWHRVALAVDLAAKPPVATKFVDGIKQDDWIQPGLDTDRLALKEFAILFGAGDTDAYRPWYVNSLQIRSAKLSDAELAALGGPSAAGIPTGDSPNKIAGQWDFEDGDLRATVGRPLEFFDGPNGRTATKTRFSTTRALGIPDINGEPARIMAVPADYLGNTATQVTQTAPKELTLVRNSDLAFTAVELVALMSCLEDPAFPLFGRQLPSRTNQVPDKVAVTR